MKGSTHISDSAVIALAGRRIDKSDAATPRFPLANVELVRERIAALLSAEHTEALVCSAACGADLLALGEAERLGLRRRIVLPFPPERFRKKSVIDRPGNWGPMFDRLVAAARAAGDLVILPVTGDDADAAYAEANQSIIHEAAALVRTKDSAIGRFFSGWERLRTAQDPIHAARAAPRKSVGKGRPFLRAVSSAWW